MRELTKDEMMAIGLYGRNCQNTKDGCGGSMHVSVTTCPRCGAEQDRSREESSNG